MEKMTEWCENGLNDGESKTEREEEMIRWFGWLVFMAYQPL